MGWYVWWESTKYADHNASRVYSGGFSAGVKVAEALARGYDAMSAVELYGVLATGKKTVRGALLPAVRKSRITYLSQTVPNAKYGYSPALTTHCCAS